MELAEGNLWATSGAFLASLLCVLTGAQQQQQQQQPDLQRFQPAAAEILPAMQLLDGGELSQGPKGVSPRNSEVASGRNSGSNLFLIEALEIRLSRLAHPFLSFPFPFLSSPRRSNAAHSLRQQKKRRTEENLPLSRFSLQSWYVRVGSGNGVTLHAQFWRGGMLVSNRTVRFKSRLD